MRIENILKKYDQHTTAWINALAMYDEYEFDAKPPGNGWCMGQIYDHIAKVTGKCVGSALLCAAQKGVTGYSALGPAIFCFMGSFPPVKIKVKKIPPGLENIYSPRRLDKTAARVELENALLLMQSNFSIIKEANKEQRIQHWAGGWFNAQQWYHSAEMHIKHHFRQKKRIDKYLNRSIIFGNIF